MAGKIVSFAGLIRSLLFTHNTFMSVLYTMITSNDSRHIRCCDSEGVILNRGAQFRYGVDSQYGDIVFVMKPDFWRPMKGSDHKNRGMKDHVVVGHFYKKDFIEYSGDADVFLIERWLENEARVYDYRPETSGLNGKECKKSEWNVSWCNIQLHIGENVGFEHIEKVYAPAWIVYDNETVATIERNGINTTMLRLLVTNKLTHYPFGDHEVNILNGRFELYGPPNATKHYHKIEKERGKFHGKGQSNSFYEHIEPVVSEPYKIQTHRHSSSSSAISIHEHAFVDLEVRYMADLVERNLTDLDPKEADRVRNNCLFRYPQQLS